MTVAGCPTRLRQVAASQGCDSALKIFREDGAVIIKDFLTADQVRRINEEVQPALDNLKEGSRLSNEFLQDFHGAHTKRLTDMVTNSKTFREEVLDKDFMHQLLEDVFLEDSGTYWLATGQVIEIGPASKAQPMHRDQWLYKIFSYCGPSAPEACANFMVALTQFTVENGATQVIPGSHKWDDLNDNGSLDDAVPAEMEAGDACFLSGKVLHSGGANRTKDFKRRGLALNFQPSYLTPEEAYPLIIEKELAETLSPRCQRMVGLRSQLPKGTTGLWKKDIAADDDFIGIISRHKSYN